MRYLEHAVTKEKRDFIEIVKSYREKVPGTKNANEGELGTLFFSFIYLLFNSSLI